MQNRRARNARSQAGTFRCVPPQITARAIARHPYPYRQCRFGSKSVAYQGTSASRRTFCSRTAGLCSVIDEIRCGAPGATHKRLEAAGSFDASNRVVCTHASAGFRAECHRAVGPPQLAKCARAVFELDQALLGWRSIGSDFLLPVERLAWGSLMRGGWQSAHFVSYQDGDSHRLRAQLRCTHIFRAAGERPKLALLARELGKPRRMIECMQCARESLLLLLRVGWATRLRHKFQRLSQRIAGLCH